MVCLGYPSNVSAQLSLNRQAAQPAVAKRLGTVATSDSLTGNPDETLEFRGKVQVQRDNTVIHAPEVDYNALTDDAVARGGVVVQRGKDVLRAPEFKLNLNTQAGYAPFPEFFYAKNNGRGDAKHLTMSADRRQVLEQATYTSCKPGQNDWMLHADAMTLDESTETGTAKGVVLRFFDLPIFALPHFEFPLGNERRSGVLPANFGINTISGYEVSVPYYINLAHNYDLTLTPRLMTKRGLQLTAQTRYLGQSFSGNGRIDWLPHDLLKQDKRWGVFSQHAYQADRWSAGLNLERVSDNTFFADLSRSATAAAQTSLPAELWARYLAPWGEVNARASRNQTLQDASNSIVPSYERLPVLNWNINPTSPVSWFELQSTQWAGLKFESQTQFSRFKHNSLTQGNRIYTQPQLSYEYKPDWGFVTPKLALNAAHYSALQGNAYAGPSNYSRVLPLLSLDSGLTFERESTWFGTSSTQTLEPRLYFLYVPFKDQAQVPLFDTALSGFSYSQIFSNNVFTGQDRIADAKHITPALTQRWVNQATGAELFKATLGKRYYFSPQRVQLTGASLALNPNAATTSSDWLFAAAGQLNSDVTLDAALQYDQTQKEVVNSAYTLRYNPSQRQVLTLSKRFTKNTQNAVDFSWQWRTSANSAFMGRWAYSLGVPSANLPKGTTETLLGYEYDASCWTFRVAANRYTTTAGKKATNFYIHLDFSGLTQVGSGSMETLKRNIPSYQPFESKPSWTYDPFRPF
jgi:LPS-assembly protein